VVTRSGDLLRRVDICLHLALELKKWNRYALCVVYRCSSELLARPRSPVPGPRPASCALRVPYDDPTMLSSKLLKKHCYVL